MNNSKTHAFAPALPPGTEKPRLAQLAIYAMVVLGCAAVAGRLALFLHEALGHALTAHMMGADVISIEVRPFGGGRARYQYPSGTPGVYGLLSTSGGIAVDLVGTAVALGLAWVLRRRPLAVLFLSLWAFRALIGAMGYLVMGLYFRSGDPGKVLRLMGDTDPPWLSIGPWLPALLMVPFAGFAATRLYLMAQEHWLPSKGAWRRAAIGVCTVGLAFALLGLAGRVVNTAPTVPFESDAARNAAAHAKKLWVAKHTRLYRQKHPDATPQEVEAHILALLDAKKPSEAPEIPPPLPMRAIFVVAVALGCLVALIRPPPKLDAGGALTWAHALVCLGVAGALIGLLMVQSVWRF